MSGATSTAGAVAEIRTRRLRVPLHTPFVTALRRATSIETLLVEVVDADGVIGRGEAPQVWRVTGDSVAGSEACLAGPLGEALRGVPADPWTCAPLLERAVVGNRAAKAAADVALHDLVARRAGVPLAQHLGGSAGPATVRTDVTLAAGDPGAVADAGRARVVDGFGVLKLKVGTDDPDADVARVRAVRAAVGPDVALRLDANQAWRADEAVRAIRRMEEDGLAVELVEQPVPARDVLGLAHVIEQVDTPVMADESVFDLRDLVEVLRAHAADLVNVKLAKCGGITAARELLEVARRHGVGTMVGSMMESHVGVGAAAALVAATAGEESPGRVADLDAAWWSTGSPYRGGPAYDGDRVVLPATPGLGVEGLVAGAAEGVQV